MLIEYSGDSPIAQALGGRSASIAPSKKGAADAVESFSCFALGEPLAITAEPCSKDSSDLRSASGDL